MKHYNLEEFVWFAPVPKNKCAISFLREGAFNLNSALCAELGHRIDIAFHPAEPVICLRRATGDGGWKVPVSGSIQSAGLTERLLAANMKPPMRFAVTRQDDCWIAIPEAARIPETVDVKKASRRPRRVNPARLLEGVKAHDRI